MRAKQPHPCPKCGEDVWIGPRFSVAAVSTIGDAIPERLTWTCSACGYREWTLPLDVPANTCERKA